MAFLHINGELRGFAEISFQVSFMMLSPQCIFIIDS